jgi:hypothetical protein
MIDSVEASQTGSVSLTISLTSSTYVLTISRFGPCEGSSFGG